MTLRIWARFFLDMRLVLHHQQPFVSATDHGLRMTVAHQPPRCNVIVIRRALRQVLLNLFGVSVPIDVLLAASHLRYDPDAPCGAGKQGCPTWPQRNILHMITRPTCHASVAREPATAADWLRCELGQTLCVGGMG